jgi:membrane fusion protein (multidrug efflux system)
MKLMASVSVSSSMILALIACGGSGDPGGNTGSGRPGTMGGRPGGGPPAAAVPVRVHEVSRRAISQYLQTNGTLEAENEVDIVARTSGPVTQILTEEGSTVRNGQLMARIDEREPKNQAAIARVTRDEAQLAFERTRTSYEQGLVSQESFDSATSNLAAAQAQLESAEIQLAYTEIRAPFGAVVVTRDIKVAQFVTSGTRLFRISDFTPLLCRVEVPEKDLPRVRMGQTAHLEVEAYPGQRFPARVARQRPTVDPTSGTFTVTLEVGAQGKLRPGLFASVYLETETHEDVLVIPRDALVLDSLGDTVYVMVDGVAQRREVRLGLRDEDSVEILDGLAQNEQLIVLGQEGLADGTPVMVLGAAPPPAESAGPPPEAAGQLPEDVEAIRQRMKERGLSEEEIEQRIQQMREGGPGRGGSGGGRAGGMAQGTDNGEIPPFMVERIKEASPEELERIKERMKQFGMSDERIEEVVTRIRGESGAKE